MDDSVCVQGEGNANEHLFPVFANLLGGEGDRCGERRRNRMVPGLGKGASNLITPLDRA